MFTGNIEKGLGDTDAADAGFSLFPGIQVTWHRGSHLIPTKSNGKNPALGIRTREARPEKPLVNSVISGKRLHFSEPQDPLL